MVAGRAGMLTLNVVPGPSLHLAFPVCEDGGGEDWEISTVMSSRQKIDMGKLIPDDRS